MKRPSSKLSLSALIQDFFCQRLIQQQNASQRTISSYRDTFRLLLNYLTQVRRKKIVNLAIADLDAPVIAAFLNHLETQRRNSIRTRNARFAAIRSFMKYTAARDPTALAVIQRVLALPMKRFPRAAIRYLTREEMSAILDAPDDSNWSGRRDRVLFALMYNTGARVSEIISLRRADVRVDSSKSVRLMGKGRKERVVPLWKSTIQRLQEWMKQIDAGPDTCVFTNRNGQRPCVDIIHNNSIRASTLLRSKNFAKRLPAGIVTPTGEWVEHSALVTTSSGWYLRETPADVWCNRVRRILEAFPKHRVVCVDVHN